MISLLRKLFCKEQQEPDISEPVYSFLECVKSHPKRFKITKNHSGSYVYFSILDRGTQRKFEVRFRGYPYKMICSTSSTSFFTEEELWFAYKEIETFYTKYNLERKVKVDKYRRMKLCKEYCK